MDTGLTIHFKPSGQLVLFYLVLMIISLMGVVALPLTTWIKLLIGFAVLVSILVVLWRDVLMVSKNSIVALSYQPQLAPSQRWKVGTKAGRAIDIALDLQACYVSPYLTVLNFHQPQKLSLLSRFYKQQSLVILPDRLSRDEFRRLRVLLNWGNLRGEESPV